MAEIKSNGLFQGDLITFIDNTITMMTEFKTDFNATLAKLDADVLVGDTNYVSTTQITASVPSRAATIRKDGIHQGDLYTLISSLASFASTCATKYAALLAKLDADGGVNLTTYASGNPVTSTTPSASDLSGTGLGKAKAINFVLALSAFFTELKADYNAVLAKLDTDTGVTDTNYAATNPVSASLSTTV